MSDANRLRGLNQRLFTRLQFAASDKVSLRDADVIQDTSLINSPVTDLSLNLDLLSTGNERRLLTRRKLSLVDDIKLVCTPAALRHSHALVDDDGFSCNSAADESQFLHKSNVFVSKPQSCSLRRLQSLPLPSSGFDPNASASKLCCAARISRSDGESIDCIASAVKQRTLSAEQDKENQCVQSSQISKGFKLSHCGSSSVGLRDQIFVNLNNRDVCAVKRSFPLVDSGLELNSQLLQVRSLTDLQKLSNRQWPDSTETSNSNSKPLISKPCASVPSSLDALFFFPVLETNELDAHRNINVVVRDNQTSKTPLKSIDSPLPIGCDTSSPIDDQASCSGASNRLFRTPNSPDESILCDGGRRKLSLLHCQRRRFCIKRSESQRDHQTTPLQIKRRKSIIDVQDSGTRKSSRGLWTPKGFRSLKMEVISSEEVHISSEEEIMSSEEGNRSSKECGRGSEEGDRSMEEGFLSFGCRKITRCHSEAALLMKRSLSWEDTQLDLIGDFSKVYCLPLEPSKHQDLRAISCNTLAKMINADFDDIVEKYIIIDSRYPYEFLGGHIKGAKNLYTKDDIMKEFFTINQRHSLEPSTGRRSVFVFHCEFSAQRGPELSRFLRVMDRHANADLYPALHYPELYILEGGYKIFYESHPHLCTPCEYVPMLHAQHSAELKHFRALSNIWAGEKNAKKK